MPPRKKQTEAPATDLKAKPGCCEEASTLSGKFYIPCNEPAVAIVGWKNRSDKPIRMCRMCEAHNLKNRGGYRVEAFAGAPAPKAPVANAVPTDNDLIGESNTLEEQIKAAQAKFDEWAKPRKVRIEEIEGELQRRLLQRGAGSTKTDNGTAYISDIMNTKIENQEILLDFVNEHWPEVGSDVKINVPIALVRSHMETNNGMPPPGISISYFKRLNIKRS